jgi:hypothetical protein
MSEAKARADEHRRKAEECRLQASKARLDDDKAAWLKMAEDLGAARRTHATAHERDAGRLRP